MSRIVTMKLEVNPQEFLDVARRKGYTVQGMKIFSPSFFRPIEIRDRQLRYDNMNVEAVSDLVADYLVETVGGVKHRVKDEIVITL